MTIYHQKRFLIVKAIGIHQHREEILNSFSEEESLIASLGGKVVFKTVQHRFQPDPATYIGKGKVEEIKYLVKNLSIDVILLNDLVSPGQIFRLEKQFWSINPQIKVWDRYDLILEVFNQRATSSEAKLQIELAKLRHLGPRIYGLGGKVLSRLGGGIGGRGLGEPKLEIMRRYIKNRIRLIEKKIAKIIKKKEEKIFQRKINGLKTLALVGYTNAGKTTLFNLLTGKNKMVKDDPFTTLDSCVGKVIRRGRKSILVADTIGFISNLPPLLIDAFKSTLIESLSAEKIFHVIDYSDKNFEEKMKIVDKILKDLEIEENKIIYVFNKIDLVRQIEKEKVKIKNNKVYFISAKTGKGVKNLLSSYE